MKKIISILISFFGLINHVDSQQNLFNIPSGDITPKNKIFYQHQFNVYNSNLDSKSHFVYGIGNGFDIGCNLIMKSNSLNPPFKIIGVNIDKTNGGLFPLLLLTLQKQFKLNEKININIGSQVGSNIHYVRNTNLAHFNYAVGTYFFNPYSRINFGLYYANLVFTGNRNNANFMFGYETKITKHFYLMGDWKLGKNDIGEGVIGFMYVVNKRFQICSGLLIPNNRKYTGLVLELNLLGWDYN
jgi:hypothetical protein